MKKLKIKLTEEEKVAFHALASRYGMSDDEYFAYLVDKAYKEFTEEDDIPKC